MLLAKTQHLLDLAITQWSLALSHFPCDGGAQCVLGQELLRCHRMRNLIVRRVEYLKLKSILLHTKIAHLAQVARVNLRPSMPLPLLWVIQISLPRLGVLVRGNDRSDAPDVDVDAVAAGKSARYAFAAEL